MEKNTNNPFHIDMDKLEYIFSATASALYGTTKEAQLFVKRMLFKTSCGKEWIRAYPKIYSVLKPTHY